MNVRRLVLVLLMLLNGTSLLAQNPGGAPANLEGRMVERIDFEPASQPLSREELLRILPIHLSMPLKRGEVRLALQALYDTGRFSDVVIDAEPSAQGIAIRITTELQYFFGGVSISGIQDPPNRGQLSNSAKLELGTAFTPTSMEQALANMLERLRANGLYKSMLDYQLTRTASTEEVAVHFDLKAGPRTHFDGVQLMGEFKIPAEKIISATRWRRGIGPLQFPGWRQVSESRIQSGIERVSQLFQKDNRLQVRVTLDHLNYHDKTNTITPTLLIHSGPIIEVNTMGAKVSRTRLRGLIPVFEERSVDQGLLTEGVRNLVDYFQAQGYFEVMVNYSETSDTPEHMTILYNIERNARHKLMNIEISGNKFFDTPTIRERLTIRENRFLRFRYGRYSPKLRDQDRDLIRDLYRSNGFRDAQVSAKTIDDFQGHEAALGVQFVIQEGQQWFVNKLEMEGVPESDTAHLRAMLQSSEGQSFSESNLAADRDTILSYYFNSGYPDATFDWTETPASAPTRVDLRYVIHTGQRQFVRNIMVRGLDTTRQSLVQNRISLHPGDALSQEQLAATQQKLYDLGVFARVQTALQNPTGKEDNKNVLLQMDEANRYSFNVGIGAEIARIGGGVTTLDAPAGNTGFSPRISAGISRLNFLGLGHTVNFQARASTQQQRAVLSYIAPQFTGNQNLSLTVSALFDTSRDVRTFAARRWETSAQLALKVSRATTLQGRFAFRRVTVDLNTLNISLELLPLLSQPVRVGIFSMSYIFDRRDNSVDSHRGVYNTVDAGISLPQFGSTTSFTRLVVRNSTYHPLSRDVVLARTFQFGYQQRLGGLADIPLAERFYAGGSSSNRAFPDNQAGPRDLETGFPLGGSALFFHSTELRFPLIGDNVGGVLFHDMGNVYPDIKSISFRFRQRGIADFNYMVQAAGFGIRYKTPIGPVRVDLSLSPNSPRFFGFQGTREQLLLNQGTLNTQRISVFQFHFSLGQTF